MRKMSVLCAIVLCQAMLSIASTPIIGLPTKQQVAEIRKDPVKWRECIEWYMIRPPTGDENLAQFRQLFGLTDDKIMQSVVMGIIRNASAKVGWQEIDWRMVKDGDERATDMARAVLGRAIDWLGFCADAEGKEFLMGIATDNTKLWGYRLSAVRTYMGRATAQEAREAAPVFLADDMRRTLSFYGEVYRAVIRAYDKAEGDTQTREAIAAAMSAALAKATNSSSAWRKNWGVCNGGETRKGKPR